MSRPLDRVLDAVYNQIPDDFIHQNEIQREFDNIKSSISYTAPELMYLRWNAAAEVLLDYILHPELEWQKTIAKIFSAEFDYMQFL